MRFIILFILALNLVSAQVQIVETEQETTLLETVNNVFSVTSEPGVIIITPSQIVGLTVLFIDGVEIETFALITEGQPIRIVSEGQVGEHEVEIRSVIAQTYKWENFQVTQNDMPLEIEYFNFNQKESFIELSAKGANVINPDTLELSVNDEISIYEVLVNGEEKIECYPTITTGKPFYMKCLTKSGPETIDVIIDVGILETHTVVVEEAVVVEEEIIVETFDPEPVDPFVEPVKIEPVYEPVIEDDIVPMWFWKFIIGVVLVAVFTLLLTIDHQTHRAKTSKKKVEPKVEPKKGPKKLTPKKTK